MHQLLVVGAGEEEAAVLPVEEAVEEGVRELTRRGDPRRVEGDLVDVERGVQQERVVVEVRVQLRLTVLEGAEQPTVATERAPDESERALGGDTIFVAPEHLRRLRERT